MNTSRIAAVTLRHAYLIRGSWARFFPLFAWVGIDMILWGFITRYLNSVTQAGMDFVPRLLGAVLLWDFFTRVMQGVTTAFFEDVWSRNFLNFFASPLTIGEYVTGLSLSGLVTSVIGLGVMLALATLVFGLNFFAFGTVLVLFLLVLFLFGIAQGIVGCAIVLRLGPAAEWFIWPIPALLTPFAAVYYPVATLPGWMQGIAYALPPSYVFEGLRSLVGGGPADWGLLLAGTAIALVYVGLAGWLFVRVFRRTVRTGLLARTSAETSG